MKTIVLNKSNIVPGTNNARLQYDFPSTIEFRNDQVAVANLNLSVSWINVGTKYNNNFFQYVWYDALGPTTYNVSIPDGFYSVADLNAFLQFTMVNNGHYLVDPFGNFVYYLEMVVNLIYYGIELKSNPIPTALPGGWSNPAGLTFPAVASTPQFIIPTSGINTLLGIPAGTYPPVVQPSAYNFIGPPTAEITPVTNIIVLCSLVRNNTQYPNNVLYTFVPRGGSTFPINISPNEYIFVNITDGFYSQFVVEFVDQLFRPLTIGDPQIFVQLIFKTADETLIKV